MEDRKPSYEELVALIAELRQRIAVLEAELAEARQVAARQAAPFRRREQLKKPAEEQKSPGRKPGHEGHARAIPARIDQAHEVPLACCPQCQGALENVRRREQVVEELPPVEPLRVKLITYTGECPHHGLVESRHPLQTSTAVGAAGVHLGPRAQATAVALSHQSGLSTRRTCQVLKTLCGLSLTPGGLSQLLQRVARRTQDWYAEIEGRIRASAAVYADETSWYVGCPGWWLWVFTTPSATLYQVREGRGSDVVRDVLGEDFAGVLVSDCLASYNPLACRKHKCLAHHLRVLKEHEQTLSKRGRTSTYLTLWKLQLQDVIATWRARVQLSAEAYAAKVEQIRRGIENLLDQSPAEPEEIRFRDRLRRQRPHLVGCLDDPAAEPTNNRAERDLRPAVMQRKTSSGNKTERGKAAWEQLRSIVVTATHEGCDLLTTLADRLSLAPV